MGTVCGGPVHSKKQKYTCIYEEVYQDKIPTSGWGSQFKIKMKEYPDMRTGMGINDYLLSDNNQKGSGCRTMIIPFRRLLGVMETRIDVDIKIRLTCFAHSTIAKVGVMAQPMKKDVEESISHDTITNKMKT